MQYLYMDNYRGFTKTLVPIRKVNFLVGENSTGKSSLLALLSLLMSQQYVGRYEFSVPDHFDLGGFKDIVSVDSPDKRYFTIGAFSVSPENSESSRDSGCSFLNGPMIKKQVSCDRICHR